MYPCVLHCRWPGKRDKATQVPEAWDGVISQAHMLKAAPQLIVIFWKVLYTLESRPAQRNWVPCSMH